MSIIEAERRLSQGDYEGALSIANQMLDLDSSNTFCRQFRAWVHQCIGGSSISLALVDYKRCLEDRQKDPSVLVDRAIAHIRRSEYHLAIRDLTVVIDLCQSFAPVAYWLRSLAHRLQGQIEKALVDINEAIAIKPNQIQYLVSRADLLRHMRRERAASVDIEMILTIDPINFDANQ